MCSVVFGRPVRECDLVMPCEGRAVAREIGVEYYETSVLTYFGVNEVFDNVIRAALISRRQQRFWMTNLKRVQRPTLQVGQWALCFIFAILHIAIFLKKDFVVLQEILPLIQMFVS